LQAPERVLLCILNLITPKLRPASTPMLPNSSNLSLSLSAHADTTHPQFPFADTPRGSLSRCELGSREHVKRPFARSSPAEMMDPGLPVWPYEMTDKRWVEIADICHYRETTPGD
jgi:hypothetical protein